MEIAGGMCYNKGIKRFFIEGFVFQQNFMNTQEVMRMKDFMKAVCVLAAITGAIFVVAKLADRFCGMKKRNYMTVE